MQERTRNILLWLAGLGGALILIEFLSGILWGFLLWVGAAFAFGFGLDIDIDPDIPLVILAVAALVAALALRSKLK